MVLFDLDLISNYLHCLLYNSYDVTLEKLALEQHKVPQLIFFFILITCLIDIDIDKERFCLGHS